VRKAAAVLGLIAGIYLIGRAVVEAFTIDISDPASYRDDWGGPSLLGVLAVHSGPGLLAAAAIVTVLLRRRSRRTRPPTQHGVTTDDSRPPG
jgi:hypothetical protein